MIEKILCATDGSHSARKAVDFAARLARQCGAHVAFVVVNTVTEEKLRTTAGWSSEELGVARAQIRGELDHAREVAQNEGADFGLHDAEGRNVAETIVAFARSEGCDHIVVGSAGRTGLAGALIGSVARSVVIQATCPVTVVR
jgi:nucleotide-binding universal stress UspA family protein